MRDKTPVKNLTEAQLKALIKSLPKGKVRLLKKMAKGEVAFIRMPLVNDVGEPIGEVDIPMPPAGSYSTMHADLMGNPFWFPGIAGPRRFQKINKLEGPDLVA